MLLERDQELARIEEAVVATSRGGYGLLLTEGPAGIGKTALLASARRLGREHGFLTMGARGSDVEAAFPFGVVRQLFAPYLSRTTASERRLALSGGAAGAGRLLAARLAGNDARAEQEPSSWFAALNSLYLFTANVAAQQASVARRRRRALVRCAVASLPALLGATVGAGVPLDIRMRQRPGLAEGAGVATRSPSEAGARAATPATAAAQP
jgi:hypothetical protein